MPVGASLLATEKVVSRANPISHFRVRTTVTSPEQSPCGLILLAAGASQRMGRPKQLLPIEGQPLLRHVVDTALAAPVSPVVVVLGAHSAEIAPCLAGLDLRVVINHRWAEGIGGSLRTGMDALVAAAPAVKAVIVALADQPDFSSAHLGRLIEIHGESGKSIVTSEAGQVWRPPVLFAAEWFPRLRELEGDAGARILLQEQRAYVAVARLPASVDLDTPADYERFLRGRR
jgi:molybdenum cofactor cytidylyltransferase